MLHKFEIFHATFTLGLWLHLYLFSTVIVLQTQEEIGFAIVCPLADSLLSLFNATGRWFIFREWSSSACHLNFTVFLTLTIPRQFYESDQLQLDFAVPLQELLATLISGTSAVKPAALAGQRQDFYFVVRDYSAIAL